METFHPHPLLRNPHAQTFASAFWPRRFPRLPRSTPREFEIEPGTRIRGECHWKSQPRERPTLVLLHGLEGSSQSGYMLGLAERAFSAGWNAVRLNQRNCGGTESLTPTLYNSGLSGDYRAVLIELIERDSLSETAVCPALELALCVDAVDRPSNFVYQRHFVSGLKDRMRRKAKLFPGMFDLARMARVRTLREFDDVITATYCGFRDASDYYARSSALRVVSEIRVPTLVVTAQDDPFVPFASFSDPSLAKNPQIRLIAPSHGGHCAFISRHGGEDRFWAEARLMEFFRGLSTTAHDREETQEPLRK